MNNYFINENTFVMGKVSGIYVITNRNNNRFYIGESLDIKNRWDQHTNELKNNIHSNSEMQSDYNKYSGIGFDFKIILPHFGRNGLNTKAELIILESAFIEYYSRHYKLYNIENTLQNILNNQKIQKNIDVYMLPVIKREILKVLFNKEVVWIDNTPMLVELPLLEKYLSCSKTEYSIRNIISKMPTDIKNKTIREKNISYLSMDNEIIIKTLYIIKDLEAIIPYLFETKCSNEKIIKSKLKPDEYEEELYKNINIKYDDKIPQTELYKLVIQTGIVNSSTFSYKIFKEQLLKHDIYQLDELNNYIPTKFAVDNNIVESYRYYGSDVRIYFTNYGKKYIYMIY